MENVCDFCECSWDEEDDQLVPLHLGDPPQPRVVTARGVQDNSIGSWKDSNQAKLDAIINALNEMSGMEYEVYEKVREVKAVGGKTHFAKTTSTGEMYFDSEETDRTAAELRFHPEAREVEPDAMVCEGCAEMFKNLDKE